MYNLSVLEIETNEPLGLKSQSAWPNWKIQVPIRDPVKKTKFLINDIKDYPLASTGMCNHASAHRCAPDTQTHKKYKTG